MTNIAQSQAPGGVPISSHVKTCQKLHLALISALEVGDSELPDGLSSRFSDQKGRFAVWCGNIGAHKIGSSSLEHRLRDASHIKEHVLGLLEELQGLLKDATDIVSGEVTPWDQMPEENTEALELEADDLPATELEQIAMDVKEVIDNLLGISITIKNPAPHDRFIASQSTDTSHFEAFDVQHVQAKFPHIEPWLTERLGRSISRRRQYFKYREAHHNKLAEGLDGDAERVAPSTIASSIPDHLKNGRNGYLDIDQGSDTDILSQTSFATSAAATDNSLRVPPLPAEASQGPFECPFCYMIVNIQDRRLWKKHVFGDLRPYICVERQCISADAEFARRTEWIEHMKASHWTTYYCPDGCGCKFQKVIDCKAHLESAHPGQFEKYQEDAVIRLNAQQTLSHIQDCPLCGERLYHLKSFQKHVGRHQEQLSLFALPLLEDGNNEGQREESEGESGEAGGEEEGDEEGPEQSVSEATNNEHQDPLDEDFDPNPGPSIVDIENTTDEVPAAKLTVAEAAEQANAEARRQKLEAQVREDAEEAFQRRLDDMKKEQEEAKRMLEDAKAKGNRDAVERAEHVLRTAEAMEAVERYKKEENRRIRKAELEAVKIEHRRRLLRLQDELARSGVDEKVISDFLGFREAQEEAKSESDRAANERLKAEPRAQAGVQRQYKDTMQGAEVEAQKYSKAAEAEALVSGEKKSVDGTTQLQQIEEDSMHRSETDGAKKSSWAKLAPAMAEESRPSLTEAEEEELERAKAELDEIRKMQAVVEAENEVRYKDAENAVQRYKEAERERLVEQAAIKEATEREYLRRLEEQLVQSGVDEKDIKSILRKEKISDGTVAEQDSKGPSISHPTFTRMSRRHLSIESLRVHGLEWDMDKDTEYVLIRRWVPEWEQDMLWKHTRELRQKRQLAGNT